MDQPTLLPDESLSSFIRKNLEAILVAWEKFAKSLAPAQHMSTNALRDHASGMLTAIADDLDSGESLQEQHEKSWGMAPSRDVESEAARHGAARVASGFSFDDTLSEFRALRASVLMLWSRSKGQAEQMPQDDMVRFNEAIDQAITESMQRYALDKDETARRFETLVSSSPDLQCILRPDGHFIYLNQALAQLFGGTVQDLVGKSVLQICPTMGPAVLQDMAGAIGRQAPQRSELRCTARADIGPVTYRCVYVPLFNAEGEAESVTFSARDFSELKASEDKILRQAYYDALTDLPNRMLFRDRIEQDLRHARRTGHMVGLLYIDLDGFKEVNDRFGHDAGDAVLKEASQRIHSLVRASDTVARLGGDEFAVILNDVSRTAHIELLAQEMLDELARPFDIGDRHVTISGSIGITLYPQDGSVTDDLIRNADQAMFVAKKAGRNRFSFFTTEMRDSAWARLKVIDELRQAVAGGQLAVFYQPIVDLRTGAIAKAEALVRWQHPETGLVLPSEFIALAEETGLINEIDTWVLEQALVRARHWSAMVGGHFQVSVNRSPLEFMSRSRIQQDDPDLEKLSAAGGHVAVEITENVMLNDSPRVREKLRKMQAAGVQLALDDFGTGYSSMAYLKKFKVDFLKIDQSFVRDMMESAESRIFAETIVLMAHRLGLKVIAEGVETGEQRDWLRTVGCDFAQGFLYSEPTDPGRFERLLTGIWDGS